VTIGAGKEKKKSTAADKTLVLMVGNLRKKDKKGRLWGWQDYKTKNTIWVHAERLGEKDRRVYGTEKEERTIDGQTR